MRSEASRYRYLAVTFCYDELDSVRPSIFSRGARSSRSRSLRKPQVAAEQCMHLRLTSRLGSGATGLAHGGTIHAKSKATLITATVAAKFAFSEETQRRLQEEFSVLQALCQLGVDGVPEPIGFYHDLDDEGPSCIVMSLFPGKSLARIEGQMLTQAQR